MIGYLRGEILENTDGRIVVVAGSKTDPGAIGYLVNVPQSPSYLGFLPGKSIELFVHTHVREDALDLYGFASRVEKELFLTLLSVNGIGPKGAIGMLSKVDPSDLIQAVLDKDKDALTQIPGIGKKTAERVVLELADPLRKKMESGSLVGIVSAKSPAKTSGKQEALDFATSGLKEAGAIQVFRDAKEALVGLGYREQDVAALLNKVMAESAAPPKKAEDLVKTALRQLM